MENEQRLIDGNKAKAVLTMDVRWKLDKLLGKCLGHLSLAAANDLIANGVTVQELDGCSRCKDSQKMTVTISNKLIDGVNTGWLGGNLPARYCPFCGRRLPQPPKGE